MIVFRKLTTVRDVSQKPVHVSWYIPPFHGALDGGIVDHDKGQFGTTVRQGLVEILDVIKDTKTLMNSGSRCGGVVRWPVV
jgi:hypothetical protein